MRRPLLLVVLLLAFAGGLRLWAAEHARFTGDESDYWAKARRVATGDFLPVYGQPITGTIARFPGPGCYYLMALPQVLSPSPRAGSAFVVALHLLAGALLFLVARAARSARAGVFALAVFAVAPWDILYGDRIWLSCVIPALGALGLYAAHRARDSGPWQGTLLFVCLVLPQFHLSAPVLWGACLALVLLRPPHRIAWRALGVGLLFAALTYLPTLIAELRSGFANTQAIFAKSGGAEAWGYAILNPLRVLGYMVLYGSGEIGYHFARGYWGGGFEHAAAYFTGPGWRAFFARYGALVGALGVVSLLLSLAAWLVGVGGASKQAKAALQKRSRDPIDLEHALILALIAGFVGGGLLLTVAKKTFFPHYANILMPMALFPVAALLDRIWARHRIVAGALLAATATFMLVSTVRYYREVDSLNGLANTLGMVDVVVEDGTPSRVDFRHFRNDYAWGVIADVLHGRSLPRDPSGRVRWVVHNHAVFEGELPPGGQRFGSVMMQRIPPEGGAPPEGSEVVRSWRRFEVEAEHPDGRRQTCTPEPGRCRYGEQPWQRFGPEAMPVGGQPRWLLFMHPIEGAVVRARRPLPAGTSQVELRYALSDGACASANQTPVRVTVLDGGAALGTVEAGNLRGLHTETFTRSSTATGQLTVEIRTEDEGARIFGFDLELR